MADVEDLVLSVTERVAKLEATVSSPDAPGNIQTPVFLPMEHPSGTRPTRINLGKYNGSGRWEDFLCQFRRASKVNRWTEDDRIELLCLHLEGTALEFVNGLPVGRVQRFEDLVEALEGRFGTERMATVFKCELRQRKRKRGESLPDLGQELRRLYRLAYPRATQEEQEEQLVDRFIEALGDRQQRLEVRRGRPQTLEEAIHVAMDAEAWEMEEEDGKRARAVSVDASKGDPMVNLLTNLTGMVEDLSRKLSANGRADAGKARREPVKCYQCGKEGHYKSQCPQLSGNGTQSH